MSNCSTIKPRISTEKFISECNVIHGNFYDYSKTKYTGAHNYIDIVCPNHGPFTIKAYAHKGGKQGCSKCGMSRAHKKNCVSFNEFLRRSKEAHGEFYSYHESDYESITKETKITCPIHGDFMQLALVHSKGHGCIKCGRNLNGFGRRNFKNICDKNNNGAGSLYLIKCWNDNETFYKVGITSHKNQKARFHGKFMPYNYEFISIINDNANTIYDLETQIHRLLKSKKYTPSIEFKGMGECFSSIPRKVLNLIKNMEQSGQLILVA
jgi:hypothetical protein